MKKIIIVILCLGMTLSAYAQRGSSAESGTKTGNSVFSVDSKHLNKVVATYVPGDIIVFDDNDETDAAVTTFMRGYTALGMTYTHSIAVARFPLYVEFGGGFQYSFKTSEDFKMISFYVPINLLYRFSFSGGKTHIAPFTGFYGRYNAWSKRDNDFLLGEGSYLKRAQLGWQIGASLDVNNFYIHFAYSSDISSIMQDSRGYFRGFNLGIGVIF